MAGIYFDASKWFAMLRQEGCTQQEGKDFKGRTQHYFLWETPWGHKFIAPHHCTYSEAEEIIEREIRGTKPPCH